MTLCLKIAAVSIWKLVKFQNVFGRFVPKCGTNLNDDVIMDFFRSCAVLIYQEMKEQGTSAPIFSRSVSGNAGTERLLAFPPPHTSPPSINLPAGKKSYLPAVYIDPKISTKNESEAKTMNIGIDHGYYAIKTRHCSFPAGLTAYGSHEPYTRQGLLESGGCFFVCGTGRQPIQRDKTINDNYYLLTLAALAQEIRSRGAPTECTVRIAAGLPLTSYGRDKPKFRSYLLRPSQPVQFRYEGVEYSIAIADVQLFPQGFAALMAEPDLLTDEPSLLLMDIGGWTVDLMRIDNALPVAETAHSLELGMIRCIDEIRERVRQETGLSLTDAQIEQILAGQPCSLPDEVRSIVNKQGRLYTERLFSAVMEAGFDLHAMPLVMLGGGACIVNRHVSPKDGLCRVIPLLDDRVNAIGFERALGRVQGTVSEG